VWKTSQESGKKVLDKVYSMDLRHMLPAAVERIAADTMN